jgi:ribosome recycling factor
MTAIEKAIRDLTWASIQLMMAPSSGGVASLTEDRRREYIKMARNQAEDSKVTIRNIRRAAKEALEALSKDGDAGEDDVRRAEKQLEDLTAKHVAHVDDILKHKEAELLEV